MEGLQIIKAERTIKLQWNGFMAEAAADEEEHFDIISVNKK